MLLNLALAISFLLSYEIYFERRFFNGLLIGSFLTLATPYDGLLLMKLELVFVFVVLAGLLAFIAWLIAWGVEEIEPTALDDIYPGKKF